MTMTVPSPFLTVPSPSLTVLLTLLLALGAGYVAEQLHVPLPWMIGPLFLVAILRMAGLKLRAPPAGRQTGQWAIGTALGLYFTPATVTTLATHAPLIVVTVLSALGFGAACALLFVRLAGVDAATAYFAALPGGASEMTTLAERHGGRVERVAAAHSLRILLVVSILPFTLTFAGVAGDAIHIPLSTEVDWVRMPWLIVAGVIGAGLFMALRIANAWVLGPMLGVGVLAVLEVPLSALPGWVVNGGQLLIGCALASRFSPEFFRAAPRFMAVSLLVSVVVMALAFGLALLLTLVAEVGWPTLALATSPGGVAEMAITAKVLQLGVPLVTACHVLRVLVLTLAAGPVWRLLARWQSG